MLVEWEREKPIVYARWALLAIIFGSVFFILRGNPEAFPLKTALMKTGVVALIYSFVTLFLIGKMNPSLYRNVCWFFDAVFTFLIVHFTGGFSLAANQSISMNPFVVLIPFLVLSSAIGRHWYYGVGSAVMVSLISFILFMATRDPRANVSAFPVVFISLFNVVPALAGLFHEQVIEVQETIIAEDKDILLEKAYAQSRELAKQEAKKAGELYDQKRKLNTIIEIGYVMGTTRILDELLKVIVTKAKEEMNTQMSFLMLNKDEEIDLTYSVGISDLTKKIFKNRVGIGYGIFGEVASTGKPERLPIGDPRLYEFAGSHEKMRNLLVVPLVAPFEDKPLGVLGVANLLVEENFNTEHENFLATLAINAAMFTNNLTLQHAKEIMYFELIQALAQAIEAKDPYTRGHVDRVGEYSVKLAHALKLPDPEVELIRRAAILHDVGKISTPESILLKPGRLDDDERKKMEEHAVMSKKIIENIQALDRKILDYVVHHHERHDGKGYPDGLIAEQIPLGAQIIAVADTFDAMTSDRPYRKGFPFEEALKRLIGSADTQFSAKILYAFFKLMNFDPEEFSPGGAEKKAALRLDFPHKKDETGKEPEPEAKDAPAPPEAEMKPPPAELKVDIQRPPK